jgi:hypothetical protein
MIGRCSTALSPPKFSVSSPALPLEEASKPRAPARERLLAVNLFQGIEVDGYAIGKPTLRSNTFRAAVVSIGDLSGEYVHPAWSPCPLFAPFVAYKSLYEL